MIPLSVLLCNVAFPVDNKQNTRGDGRAAINMDHGEDQKDSWLLLMFRSEKNNRDIRGEKKQRFKNQIRVTLSLDRWHNRRVFLFSSLKLGETEGFQLSHREGQKMKTADSNISSLWGSVSNCSMWWCWRSLLVSTPTSYSALQPFQKNPLSELAPRWQGMKRLLSTESCAGWFLKQKFRTFKMPLL